MMTNRHLSRRGFLLAASSLSLFQCDRFALSAFFGPNDSSEKPDGSVNFGFSLYGMRSLKVADALKTCHNIGYDSVELVCTKGWPFDPQMLSRQDRQDIRSRLNDLRLALPSLMENLHVVVDGRQHRQNLDRLKAAAELGHELSPDMTPVIETVLGGRPGQWDSLKEKMADGLRDWAKVSETAKTVIAVKAHVGGALHTPDGAKWLVEQVDSPWIRLAYDFSHFQLRDYDLGKSLETMIAKTVFIHVKDKQGKAGKFQFLLPGDGNIDYVKYFNLLKKHRYRGTVMVEVSGQIHGKPGYDPVQAAKHSYENLAPIFAKTGIRKGGMP